MTNILGLKQNRWIVGAVLLLTTCNLQAQEQPNAREKFERGNWFVSGALNGEWLTKTIGNVYACLLYTSPSTRDYAASRMPSSA